MEPIQTTSLRLPQNLLDRAERLVCPLGARAEREGGTIVTRSDVIRRAIALGLMELEVSCGTRRRG